MDPSLIDAITEMVLRELQGRSAESVPAPGGGRPVLLCPGPGKVRAETWELFKGLPGIAWTAVAWDRFPHERLRGFPARVVSTPPCWEQAVTGVEAVVLPSVRLETLARIALLLGDTPPAAAAVAGVVQGRPVLICAEGVERYRRHSARLPGGFMAVFGSHLRTVESLGIEVLEPPEIAARLLGHSQSAPSAAGGRDVVTMEDLEAARRRGVTVLEVSSGAIVTPLAREAAKDMGIEVRFQ